MLRLLLPISSMLAACAPSPQKVAMPSPSTDSRNADLDKRADSPEEATGRRILSTAFVRVGADAHLTVELRNGHVVVLRDVVMQPRNYCGVQVAGDLSRGKYCGNYADVAAARPGGAPSADPAVLVAPNPAAPAKI